MITAADLEKAVSDLVNRQPPRDGYTYFLPSPNPGKRLMIHGWIMPDEAASMAWNVLTGKAAVSDYPCMKEIDIFEKGAGYAYITHKSEMV